MMQRSSALLRRANLLQCRIRPRVFSTSANTTQTFDYSKKNEGKSTNIVWSEGLISMKDRQAMTGRKGATLWITGLSGSGKSTIACALEKQLLDMGHFAYRLDGDNVRFGLNKDLGFTEADRDENIRRIGEVSKLFADSGALAITAFISPYRAGRDAARKVHEDNGVPFFEVLADVPLEVAEQRDPKGLYKKARAGEIKNFTGIDDPYEIPENPEVVLPTHELDVQGSVDKLIAHLRKEKLIK